MNVAKLRILTSLCLLTGIGLTAYPVAVWLQSGLISAVRVLSDSLSIWGSASSLSRSIAPSAGNLGFFLPFPIAFVTASAVFRRQLRAVIAGGFGAGVRGAIVVAFATCIIWMGLLFTLSLLGSLDRLLAATAFLVTAILLLGARLLLETVFRSSWSAIGGAAAVLVVSYGLAQEHAALRAVLTLAMALSMLVGFSVLGGALARRDAAPPSKLIASAVAGHVLFVTSAFFLGALDALPRGILLASLLLTLLLGFVPILIETVYDRGEGKLTLYHPGRSSQTAAWAELVSPSMTPTAGDAVWIVQRGEGSLERLQFLAGALADAGRVVVVCLPAALAGQVKQGPWVVSLPQFTPLRLSITALLGVLRGVARLLTIFGQDRIRQFIYANYPQVIHDKVSLRRFAVEHPKLRPCVVICVDWEAGPAAAALAQSVGAKLVYDVSEYEPEQYFNDARWAAKVAPIAETVAAATQRAAALTTVAAEVLLKKVRDRNPRGGEPLLVRSAPAMVAAPVFQRVEGRIQLLYSGDIVGSQGIEALVDAMSSVRVNYRLTLSGQADHSFLGDLKRRIVKLGLEQDIVIDLLDAAMHERSIITADAGIVLWPGDTPKSAYAVPQQLIEHVQAGRAVFLVGAGEAADLVRANGIGAVVGGHSSADIAATLNSIDARDVDDYKRAAVAAAVELNRAHSGQKLMLEL